MVTQEVVEVQCMGHDTELQWKMVIASYQVYQSKARASRNVFDINMFKLQFPVW